MLTFNPYDREYGLDPYPLYARLRDEAPVYHNPEMKFWALSRFEDVLGAHRDAKLFSSAGGVTIEGTEAAMPFLIVKDQPEHTWAKALVVKMFSRSRMMALDAFIRTKAADLLETAYEKHGPDGEFDFVKEFSVQLPLSVISELLGIPEELRTEIHQLSNVTIARGPDMDANAAATATMRTMQIYMGLAADRRANPRDDVVSMLIAEEVKDEHGGTHHMEDHEIAARFLEMGFAGHETVAKAIPNGAMAFHRFPEERARLLNDRSLLKNAVDEILRYDPPSQLQGRTTTRDVNLHDVTIPAGQKVMLVTGAATRDPRQFEHADTFDITRPVSDYLSVFFGFGIHKCLGIHLARQEVGVAFDELLNRFPHYEVAPERATRAILSNVRGVASLPIVLGRHA
jgi:cytochrome P450